MNDETLTTFQYAIFFISISLATFLMVLDYSIANIALPYISGGLAVSDEEGIYIITIFAAGNAIGLAATGWIAKRFGEIKTLTVSIALFTIISFFCGISISLTMILSSRFFQGLVAGPIIPLSQSLIRRFSTSESFTRNLSIWASIIVTAPVIGPILGGYISDWYSWPWIFFINIPIGIFSVLSLWTIMRKKESKTENIPSDYTGMILLAIGVTCLQFFLDKGQQWDWFKSTKVYVLMIGSILGFTYLVIREKLAKNPFMDLKLLKIPSFLLSIICLIFSYAMYFGSVVIVPLWLQEYMSYNAVWAGIAVCSLGIAPVLFSLITPIFIKKFGAVKTLIFSFFCFAVACFYSSYFTVQSDVMHISFARFLFGFGIVFFFTPLLAVSMQDIPQERLSSATSFFHFIRAMIGGVGASVFTTIWTRRTYFHHMRIGETLTRYNPILPPFEDTESLTILNDSVDVQAAMLAMNDTFYLMGWLFLGLIFLLIGWLIFRKEDIKESHHITSE